MEHTFSEGFDAKAFYMEKMSEGWSFRSDEDPYGWDDLGQPQVPFGAGRPALKLSENYDTHYETHKKCRRFMIG